MTENSRVGGSIPPLATILFSRRSASELQGKLVKRLAYSISSDLAGGVKNWDWTEQA